MRSVLASPRLRRIVAAYAVNRLGTWIGVVALLVAVFDHTHSALAVAAVMFASQALPAFVVPPIVARVEASRRGSEISGLYFFEALATALLAVLLLWRFSLPVVLLLAALDGTAALAASALLRAAVARAGRESVEPSLVHGARGSTTSEQSEDRAHEGERHANAALNVAFSSTFVTGPIVGGALVAAAGAPAALFVDVASFVVCGALLLDLRPHVEEADGDAIGARLRAAWRHIRETPLLPTLLIVEAVAWVFFESGGPIEVPYAKGTLHAGDRGFGLLLSCWGAGAVLGSVIFARSLRRPLGMMLCAGMLGIGLGYTGFAAAPSLPLACIAALVGGTGNGVQWAALFSAVQRLTPQHLHGRLMGAVESLSALCLALGLTLGGVLVSASSPRIAFLSVGLGAIATTVALVQLPLWRLKPRASGDDAAPAKAPAALAREPGVEEVAPR